jgi:hypothetical protein
MDRSMRVFFVINGNDMFQSGYLVVLFISLIKKSTQYTPLPLTCPFFSSNFTMCQAISRISTHNKTGSVSYGILFKRRLFVFSLDIIDPFNIGPIQKGKEVKDK